MRFLVSILVLVTACGSTRAGVESQDEDSIAIGMSLYVIDDADGGAESPLSSKRDLDEIESIAERVKAIWGQAGIDLTVETIARIQVPSDVLLDLGEGVTSSFLNGVAAGAIPIPGPATINGFYVARIGTANGMAPQGTRLFFVTDNPSVNDERVSSHEIGHILGLHHALDDENRLMFSGTNGIDLVDAEVSAARYAASGVVDGVR